MRNSERQTYQILTNDDEVCISSFSCILLTATTSNLAYCLHKT